MGVFRLTSTRRENRPYPLRGSDMDRRVRAAISLMQTELDRKLSILELAHRVNLSGGHFSRLFKAESRSNSKVVPTHTENATRNAACPGDISNT